MDKELFFLQASPGMSSWPQSTPCSSDALLGAAGEISGHMFALHSWQRHEFYLALPQPRDKDIKEPLACHTVTAEQLRRDLWSSSSLISCSEQAQLEQ